MFRLRDRIPVQKKWSTYIQLIDEGIKVPLPQWLGHGFLECLYIILHFVSLLPQLLNFLKCECPDWHWEEILIISCFHTPFHFFFLFSNIQKEFSYVIELHHQFKEHVLIMQPVCKFIKFVKSEFTCSDVSSPSAGTGSAPTTGGSRDLDFFGKGVKPFAFKSDNRSARLRLFTIISPCTTPRMNRTLLSTFRSSYCRFSSWTA